MLLDLAFLHSHYLLLDWRFLVCLIKLLLDLTTFAILLLAFSIIHLLFLSCDICLFFPTSYAFFITELLVSVQFSCSLVSDPL